MNDFSAAATSIIDDYLKHEPIEATLTGLHTYDCELPDVTLDGFAASNIRAKAYLATLGFYRPEELSAAERIDHAMLASRFETDVREYAEVQPQRHDPSIYPDTAIHGIYSLLARDFAPLEDRVPSLEARLEGVPKLLAAGVANLDRSPAIWTEIAIDEAAGGIDFFESDVLPLCDRYPHLRKPLERAVDAFRDYGRFLADKHHLRDGMSFAVGREMFDYKLEREHLLPFDSDSLLAFGQDALRSTVAALETAAAQIDKTKTWGELIELLRKDHPDERQLLTEYRRGVDEAKRFVEDHRLVTMPADDRLDVVETPAFMRPTVPYAAYMPPGPYEERQHGLYYVTPVSAQLSREERAEALLGHNRYGMLLTNVHEAYPGHHLQLVKANEGSSIVRKLLENTVLIEGWALYCEQLVLDEGMTSDPRVRLFQLKDQLWRACRVVIDVELHTGAMTFDEAVAMLVDIAHLERPNALGEVRRYTQSPTQPMSYLTGKHQIMALREREKARLGAKFDLRGFHDRLLSYGSIPVSLIEPTFAGSSP
jgi:uncharacterized protein (DUF885 family)